MQYSPRFMREATKYRANYFAELYQQKIQSKWISYAWAMYGILAAWKTEVLSPSEQEKLALIKIIPEIPLLLWVIIFWIITIVWLFEASFRIQRKSQARIAQLNKIDRDDIAHMLDGFFLGNTFTYNSEVTRCKPWEYKTEYDFEKKLRNKWTQISVPAPRNSLAKIKFFFSNGHPKGQIDFYVQGQDRESIRVNIYSDIHVLLDAKSCFSFMLTYSDDYEINELISLRIEIESWTK